MGGLKGTAEELRAEEGKVVMDGKDFGFCVKMVNRTHLHTAGGYAEGGVLDTLQFFDVGGGGVGELDRGDVDEEGGDKGFVCEEKILLALSPGSTSKGPQDVEARGGTRDKG